MATHTQHITSVLWEMETGDSLGLTGYQPSSSRYSERLSQGNKAVTGHQISPLASNAQVNRTACTQVCTHPEIDQCDLRYASSWSTEQWEPSHAQVLVLLKMTHWVSRQKPAPPVLLPLTQVQFWSSSNYRWCLYWEEFIILSSFSIFIKLKISCMVIWVRMSP